MKKEANIKIEWCPLRKQNYIMIREESMDTHFQFDKKPVTGYCYRTFPLRATLNKMYEISTIMRLWKTIEKLYIV